MTEETKKEPKSINARRIELQNRNRDQVPSHVLAISDILIHNSDIRRSTSFGILNYLSQKGFVNATKETSKYVEFKQDKFSVVIDGLRREYRYNEYFFLNAFAASFISVSLKGQRAIDFLVAAELGRKTEDILSTEEVNETSEAVFKRMNESEKFAQGNE